ncbi:MAG: hypothetical protein QHJ81_14860 [Anaerolineae bacterium]|nr:hypothetical protein [Anaerolineae bacterium]
MATMETGRPPLEQPEEQPPHEEAGEPVDEEQQIRQAATTFLGFLEREPGAVQGLERIIGEHLRGRPDTDTAQRLFNSLTRCAGEDNANFLLSLLMRGVDNPEFFARVGEVLGGEAWAAVRTLSALYGDAVQEAYLVGGENPNAWRTINRQVYYDVMSGRWRMTFEIIKYNGERVLYEETATTLLILADAIVDTLNHVPADIAPGMIDRSRLETFYNTCTTFFKTYAPAEGQEAEEQGHEGAGE